MDGRRGEHGSRTVALEADTAATSDPAEAGRRIAENGRFGLDTLLYVIRREG